MGLIAVVYILLLREQKSLQVAAKKEISGNRYYYTKITKY